jgi:hypothetical protein
MPSCKHKFISTTLFHFIFSAHNPAAINKLENYLFHSGLGKKGIESLRKVIKHIYTTFIRENGWLAGWYNRGYDVMVRSGKSVYALM